MCQQWSVSVCILVSSDLVFDLFGTVTPLSSSSSSGSSTSQFPSQSPLVSGSQHSQYLCSCGLKILDAYEIVYSTNLGTGIPPSSSSSRGSSTSQFPINTPSQSPLVSGSQHSRYLCSCGLKILDAYEILFSTNFGAIIGGVIGGLVVLGVIIMTFLYSRRKKRKRKTEELHWEPWPVILDSSPMEETTSLPLSNAHTARLPPTILDYPNYLSESTTPAPSSRSVAVAPSGATNSVQLTHEPMASAANAQENSSNYELTDQQADLVNGLWSASVSARDIARVIARMRAGEPVGDIISGCRRETKDELFSSATA
jgi:hypothetical protein